MDEQRATLSDVPATPAWRWTRWEVTMLAGMPLVAYLGGVALAFGAAAGLILVAFAALGMVTFQAMRVGRRNQPRIVKHSAAAAIMVAVITVITGWNLLQFAPHPFVVALVVPAIPVALFVSLVALMRWRRP